MEDEAMQHKHILTESDGIGLETTRARGSPEIKIMKDRLDEICLSVELDFDFGVIITEELNYKMTDMSSFFMSFNKNVCSL